MLNIQTIILVLILVAIFIQTQLILAQNKKYFSYSPCFDEKTVDVYYRTIDKYLKMDDLDLTNDELEMIKTNQELRYAVNMVLNFFESIALAYNTKLIDKKWAFNCYCEPVIYVHDKYIKYLRYLREKENDSSLANQLEQMYVCMKRKKGKIGLTTAST